MEMERFQELCAAYVLHSLERDELREFQDALKEADPVMRQFYDEMTWTALHLPLKAEMMEPPVSTKERILETIAGPPIRTRKNIVARLAVALGFHRPQFALSFAFVLMLGISGLLYYAIVLREVIYRQDQELATTRTELSTEHQRFVSLQEELARKDEILKILQSPTIEVVIMQGREVNPAGYGKIIWDPEKRSAILQISNLPPAPKDKDYQLWVIKNKKPISAGVFSLTDPDKERFFRIEQLVETNKNVINAFAITLEPKGGVPQPTGQMYLLGSPSL